MTDNPTNNDEIKLSEVDWNNMTISQYNAVELKLQEKQLQARKANRGVKAVGDVIIKIHNKNYSIKKSLHNKLMTTKSEKIKQKIIQDIISTQNPVIELL